ncbi:MAG: hypothetical protein WA728_05865, partial [Xanthobacteraceae bacterium]
AKVLPDGDTTLCASAWPPSKAKQIDEMSRVFNILFAISRAHYGLETEDRVDFFLTVLSLHGLLSRD